MTWLADAGLMLRSSTGVPLPALPALSKQHQRRGGRSSCNFRHDRLVGRHASGSRDDVYTAERAGGVAERDDAAEEQFAAPKSVPEDEALSPDAAAADSWGSWQPEPSQQAPPAAAQQQADKQAWGESGPDEQRPAQTQLEEPQLPQMSQTAWDQPEAQQQFANLPYLQKSQQQAQQQAQSYADLPDAQQQPEGWDTQAPYQQQSDDLSEAQRQQQWGGGPPAQPPSADGNAPRERLVMAVTAEAELAPERKPFHKRLAKAAQSGDTAVAEEVLDGLTAAGLPPGPRAYHGLIHAYTRAGSAAQAWEAARRGHSAGALLLEESYVLLIHGHMQESKVEAAQGLLASMQSAPHVSARTGWLVLLQALLRRGLNIKATEEFVRGQQQGWRASAPIYEAMIEALCQSGNVEAAIQVFRCMKGEGVPPTTRHAYPILRTYAKGDALEYTVENLLYSLAYSDVPGIDAGCFSQLLKGMVHNWASGYGGYDMHDMVKLEIGGLMGNWGVAPDAEFHAMAAEAYHVAQDPDCDMEVPECFEGMAACCEKAEEMVPCPMEPDVLGPLLQLHGSRYPADTVTILSILDRCGWPLPPQALEADEQGHTLATNWLRDRYARLCNSGYRPQAEAPQSAALSITGQEGEVNEDTQLLEFEGVPVNVDRCVVDEDGRVLAPSKLSTAQLRAELLARGLMTEGSRKEMYKRVQAARRSSSASSVANTKAKQQEKRAKYLKTRTQNETKRLEQKRERLRSEKEALLTTYGDSKQREVMTLDLATLGLTPDDEDDEEAEEAARQLRQAEAEEAVGGGGGSDEEEDVESELEAELRLRLRQEEEEEFEEDTMLDELPDDEAMRAAQPFLFRSVKWTRPNFQADTKTAFSILTLVERLGGAVTLDDITMLIKGVKAQQSMELLDRAFLVLRAYERQMQPNEFSALLLDLLDVPIKAGNARAARALLDGIHSSGYELDDDIWERRVRFLEGSPLEANSSDRDLSDPAAAAAAAAAGEADLHSHGGSSSSGGGSSDGGAAAVNSTEVTSGDNGHLSGSNGAVGVEGTASQSPWVQ